jgi:hypothetical protein
MGLSSGATQNHIYLNGWVEKNFDQDDACSDGPLSILLGDFLRSRNSKTHAISGGGLER